MRPWATLFFCLAVAGPLPAASGYTWKNAVVPAGGFVSGVVFSRAQAGLLYARTDMGGAYRWDGVNSLWVPLTDFLSDWNLYGIESIAADPSNANVVYAAIGQSYNNTNGYVLASSDQGATWTQYPIGVIVAGNDDGRNAGERLMVDPHLPSKLYFCSRRAGLWVSTNSAATWSRVTAFPVTGDANYGLSWVLFDSAGTAGTATQTIYVGVLAMGSGNSNVYRSTNGGSTWALVPGGPSGLITPHADLGSDGNLWVAYDSGGYGPNSITSGQVWKLNTGTLAWTKLTLPGPPAGSGGYGGISVDAQDPLHAVVSTLDWWSGPDKVYSTSNGGTSWVVIGNAPNGWNAGPYASYNNNGAIWTRFCGSYDGGVGWMGDIRIDPFNSNHALYTTGGGVWDSSTIRAASPPASVTWTFLDYGLEETAIIDMTASVAGGVLLSAMGDVTGMRHNDLTQSPVLGMYCNPTMSTSDGVDYAQLNPNFVVRMGHSLRVSTQAGGYSTDNGQTWTAFASNPTGYSTSAGNGQIAVNADGTVILWALPGNTPVYSTNNGASWTNCTGLPNGAQIASDRANKNIFYGVSGTTLYVSNNGGASFSSAATYTGSLAWANRPRAVFGIAGEVWLPTSAGLYRFTNVGLGAVASTKIANISYGAAVGFGKAAPAQSHPAVYLVGTVGGTYGFYRCDDGTGAAWTRINDAQHQFGSPGYAAGDELVYGRMYLGTNGRGILYGDLASAASPTPSPSRTASPSPSRTPSPSSSASPTPTATRTATGTATPSPSASATPAGSPSASPTLSATRTSTGTATPSPSATASRSASPSPSPSASPSATATRSPTPSASPTVTPTPSLSPLLSPTASASATPSWSPTGTSSVTESPTISKTPSPSATPAPPTATATLSPQLSATPSSTETGSPTESPTPSQSPSATQTPSASPSASPSNSVTPTSSSTASLSPSPSGTATETPAPSASASPTVLPSATPTLTPTPSASPTATVSVTVTMTATPTATPSLTPDPSATPSQTPSTTQTPPASPSPSQTATAALSATPSLSATPPAGSTPSSVPGESLAVEGFSLLPNPNPTALKVLLRGQADHVRVDLWSRAFLRVGRLDLDGTYGPGWCTLALPPALLTELPNGGYFITIRASNSGRSPVSARPGRFYLLR